MLQYNVITIAVARGREGFLLFVFLQSFSKNIVNIWKWEINHLWKEILHQHYYTSLTGLSNKIYIRILFSMLLHYSHWVGFIILLSISVWAPLFDKSVVQVIFSLVMKLNIKLSSALFIMVRVPCFSSLKLDGLTTAWRNTSQMLIHEIWMCVNLIVVFVNFCNMWLNLPFLSIKSPKTH